MARRTRAVAVSTALVLSGAALYVGYLAWCSAPPPPPAARARERGASATSGSEQQIVFSGGSLFGIHVDYDVRKAIPGWRVDGWQQTIGFGSGVSDIGVRSTGGTPPRGAAELIAKAFTAGLRPHATLGMGAAKGDAPAALDYALTGTLTLRVSGRATRERVTWTCPDFRVGGAARSLWVSSPACAHAGRGALDCDRCAVKGEFNDGDGDPARVACLRLVRHANNTVGVEASSNSSCVVQPELNQRHRRRRGRAPARGEWRRQQG